MAIVLEKSGDRHRINLQKGSGTANEIKINLDWSKNIEHNSQNGDIDLDLGCFYELRNGAKTLIDGLQFSHGRGAHEMSKQDKVVTQKLHIYGMLEMIEVQTQSLERQY